MSSSNQRRRQMLWMFIAFLVFAIVVHELAHAFFMMRSKVEMKTIAIGFPPLIFSKTFTFKGVQSRPIALGVGLLPFGAYVQPSEEGEKHRRALALSDKILIDGAGIATHLAAVVALMLASFAFGLGTVTPAGWVIAGVALSCLFLFFLCPTIGGAFFLALGLLFVGLIAASFIMPGGEGVVGWLVGIGKPAGDIDDAAAFVRLAIALSLSLGAGNALPFLPLDGGRIFLAYAEKFFGEENVRPVKIAMLLGWLLTTLFIIFIVLNDLKNV